MSFDLYEYSPIVERAPIHWPGGARVAFYLGVNIEHFDADRPSTSIWDQRRPALPVRRARHAQRSVLGRADDLNMFISRGLTGPQVLEMITDQFDQLYADAADSGRAMALALHPFVIGQPFRHRYLDRALEYIAGHDRVWMTTSDEIAEHYVRSRLTPPGTPTGS